MIQTMKFTSSSLLNIRHNTNLLQNDVTVFQSSSSWLSFDGLWSILRLLLGMMVSCTYDTTMFVSWISLLLLLSSSASSRSTTTTETVVGVDAFSPVITSSSRRIFQRQNQEEIVFFPFLNTKLQNTANKNFNDDEKNEEDLYNKDALVNKETSEQQQKYIYNDFDEFNDLWNNDGKETSNGASIDFTTMDNSRSSLRTNNYFYNDFTVNMSNDFLTLVNQCSIQSFLFLLKTCHDIQTVRWIENFTQPVIDPIEQYQLSSSLSSNKNDVENSLSNTVSGVDDGSSNNLLLTYHGLYGMNITKFESWDTYFRLLLQEKSESLIIESTNVYVPSYQLDINPSRLCHRLLAVREQIGSEFQYDLSIIATMSQSMIDTYWEKQERKTSNNKNNQDQQQQHNQKPIRPASGTTGSAKLLFLELNPLTNSNKNQNVDYQPSPLRNGNYDLLILQLTQESIHRFLKNDNPCDYNDNPNKNDIGPTSTTSTTTSTDSTRRITYYHEKQFLYKFYTERLHTYFLGRQSYGRAEQFINDLFNHVPIIIRPSTTSTGTITTGGNNINDNNNIILVDPVSIATQLLHLRSNIALEWNKLAQDIPNAHIDIRRIQLESVI